MFHKITSLATLPDYILLIGFANGEFKQFDLKPLMDKYPPFATLKDVDGLYEQAKIDAGGYRDRLERRPRYFRGRDLRKGRCLRRTRRCRKIQAKPSFRPHKGAAGRRAVAKTA